MEDKRRNMSVMIDPELKKRFLLTVLKKNKTVREVLPSIIEKWLERNEK